MGLRGRPPKPTVLEIMQGRPGKRPLNKREPQPNRVAADIGAKPPDHLPESARKWWAYYGDILRDMRVLTEADLVALEGLALVTTQRIEQEANLAKAGPLYKTSTGYITISPQFFIVGQLRERELKLLREFGLTPSARTRVQTVAPQHKQNVFASLG